MAITMEAKCQAAACSQSMPTRQIYMTLASTLAESLLIIHVFRTCYALPPHPLPAHVVWLPPTKQRLPEPLLVLGTCDTRSGELSKYPCSQGRPQTHCEGCNRQKGAASCICTHNTVVTAVSECITSLSVVGPHQQGRAVQQWRIGVLA